MYEHECMAGPYGEHRRLVRDLSDEDLVRQIKGGWGEFERPLHQLNRAWRDYCGQARREAYRRGLGVFQPPEGGE